MNNTYWNNNGKYQKELERINDMMPDFDNTDNDYMNLFITMSKIYYRHYNDGDSFSDFKGDVYNYIKPFANDINFKSYECYTGESLESLIDRTIEFIKDKNLEYTQYSIYVNHDTKELSLTEKEGFHKVTSGTAGYLNDWVKSFRDYRNYQLV
jgi:hypothetical protein